MNIVNNYNRTWKKIKKKMRYMQIFTVKWQKTEYIP